MQVNLSLQLQSETITHQHPNMHTSEIRRVDPYPQTFIPSHPTYDMSFKYPYHQRLSRHRRSADDFFDNKSNIAMYIVAPILFLVFGSCCGIYCCYKCREYITEHDTVTSIKKRVTVFTNFITGKKEASRKDTFLKQLDDRERPASVQSVQHQEMLRITNDYEEMRSANSTPGVSYFPENKLFGKVSTSVWSTPDYSQSSRLSTRTMSTAISCAVSMEGHPFEIVPEEPKAKHCGEAKLLSHSSGKAVQQGLTRSEKAINSSNKKQIGFLAPVAGQAVSVKKHLENDRAYNENTNDLEMFQNQINPGLRQVNKGLYDIKRSISVTSDYDSEKQLISTDLSSSRSSNCSSRLTDTTDINELKHNPVSTSQLNAPHNQEVNITPVFNNLHNSITGEGDKPPLYTSDGRTYYTGYTSTARQVEQTLPKRHHHVEHNGYANTICDTNDSLVNTIYSRGNINPANHYDSPNNTLPKDNVTGLDYNGSKQNGMSKYEVIVGNYIQHSKEKGRRKQKDKRLVDYWR